MKYSDCRFKYERKELLREKLGTNAAWALRGLVRIYELQTADEQACGHTREYNEVGFSGVDGEILSSFAEQYQNKGFLSPAQMKILFSKMPKYWRQLDNIAQVEAA